MLDTPLAWQTDCLQQNFRALLDAMSRPGSVYPINLVDNNSNIAEAILAPLLDNSVSLADPHKILTQNSHNFLQTNITEPEMADYIIYLANLAPNFTPKLGTLYNPHLSATILLQVESLNDGNIQGYVSGPGVIEKQACRFSPIHPDWMTKRQSWVSAFPLGVDFLFFDRYGVLALPRTCVWEIY